VRRRRRTGTEAEGATNAEPGLSQEADQTREVARTKGHYLCGDYLCGHYFCSHYFWRGHLTATLVGGPRKVPLQLTYQGGVTAKGAGP
jgi:hypothetical protein